MTWFWMFALAFVSYRLGQLQPHVRFFWRQVKRRQREEQRAVEAAEADESGAEWQHIDCGAAVDHDAEFCHACGVVIETFTDGEGVERDGLPMWELGEN